MSKKSSSSAASFEFPAFYSLPPFFTTQPVAETYTKQCELWGDLILAYCKVHKLTELDVRDAAASLALFHNKSIDRRLDEEQITGFIDYLVSQGNAEWKDKKAKRRALVFYRTPAQWGALIYEYAMDLGKVDTVCTLFELQNGEDAETREFYGLETDTLMRALKALEKERKCEIFSSGDNVGVKFFSI